MAVNGIGANDQEIKQEDVATISNGEGGVAGIEGIDPPMTDFSKATSGSSFQSIGGGKLKSTDRIDTGSIGEPPKIEEFQPDALPIQETKDAPSGLQEVKEDTQPDITVDKFKVEKPKDEKKGPPGVIESDFDKFVSEEDLDKKRAELSSIYDISEAKDDIEARKLEELREFDVRNRIQQQEDEQLLTKRLKEAGNFGQGIGNSLTRSFLRDANLNATTAQGEIIQSFKNELSDLIRKNVDDINSELSDFARQEQAEIKQRRLDDINLNIDIMNSLAPDDAIEFAIMASEIYPEVSTFAKFKNPEFQEYWRNANSEQMKEFIKQIGEDANSIVISFTDNHKGTPREGIEEERAKRDLKEAYKREGEGYYVKFENWMNDLIKDPSYLNSIYSKEEAKEIIDIINTGDQEAAEEAYIDYKWDSLMNNQFKTSLVGIVEDFQPRNDAEADFVRKLSDNFANGNFKGKIRIDDDTSLSYELPDGKKVTDPRDMPGFDVLFEDWDREPYGDDRSMENDPLYFEWLTDKYIDYINNLDEGASPVSRWEFRDNMETYLNAEASGSGIANAGSDPASVDINLLPDLRGSELASVAGTGVKPSDNGTGEADAEKISLRDEQGNVDEEARDKLSKDLTLGNVGINEISESALRDILANPIGSADTIQGIIGTAVNTGTPLLKANEYQENNEVNKGIDFEKASSLVENPLVITEDGQILKAEPKMFITDINKRGDQSQPRISFLVEYRNLNGDLVSTNLSKSIDFGDFGRGSNAFSVNKNLSEAKIPLMGSNYSMLDVIQGNTPISFSYKETNNISMDELINTINRLLKAKSEQGEDSNLLGINLNKVEL